jgi:hypothetical protein
VTEGTPADRPETRARSFADGAAVLVLALFLALLVHSAYALSITYDEFAFIGRGVSTAVHGDEVVGPPWLGSLVAGLTLRGLGVREGSAAALRGQSDFGGYGYGDRIVFDDNPDFAIPFAARGADSVVVAARLALVPFALLLAVVAWRWARSLFGPGGGLCALALVVTWPDLLGHGALATNDASFAALALASSFAFDRFALRGSAPRLCALAVAVGAAFAAKVTAGFLAVGLAGAAVVAALRPEDPAPAAPLHPFGQGPPRRRALAIGSGIAIVAVLALIVLGVLSFGGGPIRTFVDRAHGVAAYHVEGPPAAHEAGAVGFAVAFALKAPLGTLVVLGLAAVASVSKRTFVVSEASLHLPSLVVIAGTCAFAAPLGTRYLLPAIPFLLVSAGRVVGWAAASRARAAALGVALLATALGCARDHPFHSTATNLLAGPRELAWERLDNSNVDWGGSMKALGDWQRAHGVERVVVVPFGTAPVFQIVTPPDGKTVVVSSVCERVARLAPWGVRGELAPPFPTLFEPEPGRVYAVSPHVLHHARLFAPRLADLGRPPVLVLGGQRPPDAIVGSLAIFDLRASGRRQ